MQKPVRGSTKNPDHIMLSINGDAKTSMTVTWRTCTEISEGYVEYYESDTTEKMICNAVSETFESDIDISNIFWAKLENLKPDTKYFYTCGNSEYRSEEYHFSTEPENLTKFKFICISDQQKGHPHDCPDYSYFNQFLKDILKEHPDTRFILTGGDNCDCGQHEVQWNGMFSGTEGVVEYIPYMMTLGNHDNRGFVQYGSPSRGRFYSEPAEFFSKQFKGSYPDNGPKDWKTENYTFDYGNVHFCIYGVNGPEDVNEWSIKDMDSTDKTWKIGSYHFPIYYSGVEGENDDAYPVMRECMEKCDILFSGHEHNFSRSFPIRNEELFDKPSQGTVHYMLANSHKNPTGSTTIPKVWHTAFNSIEEMVAACAIVEVDGDKITLTSVLNDGRIIDKCVIDKSTDTILPYSLAPVYNRTRMMFKGMQLGLCAATTPCESKDGVWYLPAAVLINFIGGYVNKTPGKVVIDIYGHTVCFKENSNIMQTEKGNFEMEGTVYRGRRGQLYVPCDSFAKALEMKWYYAKRNNFISFEHESRESPISEQP